MSRWTSWMFVAAFVAQAIVAPDRARADHGGPAAGVAIAPARLDAALRRYASEPSVGSIVTAALEAQAVDPERAQGAMTRARLGGLLPTLRLGARRGLGWDLSAVQGTTERTDLSTGDEVSLEASMTFEVDRLLFAHDEVALLRAEDAMRSTRRELARAVIRLYYERRRLQIERDVAGVYDVERAMRIAEIEAVLDAFTGGRFRRMIAAARRRARR